jgi:hypothetical protein
MFQHPSHHTARRHRGRPGPWFAVAAIAFVASLVVG